MFIFQVGRFYVAERAFLSLNIPLFPSGAVSLAAMVIYAPL